MTETPQLTYCDEEVEDILLLCYANYFGRHKQRHAPAFTDISNNKLIDHYFTHLQFAEWKQDQLRVCFRSGKNRPLPASFEMQGPKKIFQNQYVNLKKWRTLDNLTGLQGPQHSIGSLMATRERNLRVLTIANFFYFANIIPSLEEIYEALDAYMNPRNYC